MIKVEKCLTFVFSSNSWKLVRKLESFFFFFFLFVFCFLSCVLVVGNYAPRAVDINRWCDGENTRYLRRELKIAISVAKRSLDYWILGVWSGSRVECKWTFLPCSLLVSWLGMSYKSKQICGSSRLSFWYRIREARVLWVGRNSTIQDICVNYTWKDGSKFLNRKRPPTSCLN